MNTVLFFQPSSQQTEVARRIPQWIGWIAIAGTATAIFLLGARSCTASKTQSWRHDQASDFESAETQGVTVSTDGQVQLTRSVEEVWDGWSKPGEDPGVPTAIVPEPEGTLLLAHGPPGKVWRFDPKPRVSRLLWERQDEVPIGLVRYQDSVLLGTLQGRFYRLPVKSQAQGDIDSSEKVVEATPLEAPKIPGNLFSLAATGDHLYLGLSKSILRIKLPRDESDRLGVVDGQVEVSTPVLALRVAGDRLIASGKGYLWEVSCKAFGQTKPRVLFGPTVFDIPVLLLSPEKDISAEVVVGLAGEKAKGQPYAVLRIDRDGRVKTVLRSTSPIYSLNAVPNDPRTLFVGAGNRLLAVDIDGGQQRTLSILPQAKFIPAMADLEGKIYCATAGELGPDVLYRLRSGFPAQGTLESDPLDAKRPADFGAVSWTGEVPDGTEVTFATRSGNTPRPDDNWSDWAEVQANAIQAGWRRGKVKSPQARYLQYRFRLATTNPQLTPTVGALVIRYRAINQAPELSKLSVPHVEVLDGSKKQESIKLSWEAKDPNDDRLSYRVLLKRHNWGRWLTLEDSLSKAELEFEAVAVPQGLYQAKIEVSDRASNPLAESLTTEKVSEQFVIDNRPPRITASAKAKTIRVVAEDDVTPIVSAEYAVDGGKWQPLFPDDRLFDSPQEVFTFWPADLSEGLHVVVVRAKDAAGYRGIADVTVTAEKPK